jgi:hypothetical protein
MVMNLLFPKTEEIPNQLSDNEILEVSVVWGQLELLSQ